MCIALKKLEPPFHCYQALARKKHLNLDPSHLDIAQIITKRAQVFLINMATTKYKWGAISCRWRYRSWM